MRKCAGIFVIVLWLAASAAGNAPAARAGGSPAGGSARPAATCSTGLTLYNGTNLTGSNVTISTRGAWVNLSSVGFDNKTSSYLVGACAVELASGTGGGGALYTRCLSAWCEEDTLLAGWDNTFSSVYLY